MRVIKFSYTASICCFCDTFFSVRFFCVCVHSAYVILCLFGSTALALTQLICNSCFLKGRLWNAQPQACLPHPRRGRDLWCRSPVLPLHAQRRARLLGACSLAFLHMCQLAVLPWTGPTACLQGVWRFWELLGFPGLCRRFGCGWRPGIAGWF